MQTATLQGYYGSNKTTCWVLTVNMRGATWYCVEGSTNVNATLDKLYDGVNLEEVSDIECFINWGAPPIETCEDLIKAVKEWR